MTSHELPAATMAQLYAALGEHLESYGDEIGDLPVEITTEDGTWSSVVIAADLTGGSVLIVEADPFWDELRDQAARSRGLERLRTAWQALTRHAHPVEADGRKPRQHS